MTKTSAGGSVSNAAVTTEPSDWVTIGRKELERVVGFWLDFASLSPEAQSEREVQDRKRLMLFTMNTWLREEQRREERSLVEALMRDRDSLNHLISVQADNLRKERERREAAERRAAQAQEASEEQRRNAERFIALQNMDPKDAQSFFWNYRSRVQRAEAIDQASRHWRRG